MKVVYHSVEPQNKRATYTEFNTLDFNLDFSGRKMVAGSVRLEGVVNKQSIKNVLNSNIGAHSFIDTIQVSVDGAGGIVEDIQDYGHYVNKKMITSTNEMDFFDASLMTGLCSVSPQGIKEIFQAGQSEDGSTDFAKTTNDFSIKPLCGLNNLLEGSLNYSKTGNINVSIKLAPKDKVYRDVRDKDLDNTYTLSDVRISYMTEEDDGDKSDIVMETVQTVKSVVDSSYSTLNATIVGDVRNVAITFQDQRTENQEDQDEYWTAKLPELERVEFLVNDATGMIKYDLEDNLEIVERFIQSMNNGKLAKNQLGQLKQSTQLAFGVGMDFGGYLQLQDNKIRVVLKSAVTNAAPFNAYMCFKTRVAF